MFDLDRLVTSDAWLLSSVSTTLTTSGQHVTDALHGAGPLPELQSYVARAEGYVGLQPSPLDRLPITSVDQARAGSVLARAAQRAVDPQAKVLRATESTTGRRTLDALARYRGVGVGPRSMVGSRSAVALRASGALSGVTVGSGPTEVPPMVELSPLDMMSDTMITTSGRVVRGTGGPRAGPGLSSAGAAVIVRRRPGSGARGARRRARRPGRRDSGSDADDDAGDGGLESLGSYLQQTQLSTAAAPSGRSVRKAAARAKREAAQRAAAAQVPESAGLGSLGAAVAIAMAPGAGATRLPEPSQLRGAAGAKVHSVLMPAALSSAKGGRGGDGGGGRDGADSAAVSTKLRRRRRQGTSRPGQSKDRPHRQRRSKDGAGEGASGTAPADQSEHRRHRRRHQQQSGSGARGRGQERSGRGDPSGAAAAAAASGDKDRSRHRSSRHGSSRHRSSRHRSSRHGSSRRRDGAE